MGIDDQLYKEDGTWITRIDNFLLKVAALTAAPFVQEDDPNYDRGLQALIRAAAIIGIASAVVAYPVNVQASVVTTCLAVLLLVTAKAHRSNGKGCTIDPIEKYISLSGIGWCGMMITVGYRFFTIFLGRTEGQSIRWLIISGLVVLWCELYVARLGSPPPKREKAKARKLALHH